ncbi:unnamed protein product [Phaedon cochleariae]|uniref:Rho-GAP domain-containing protein n=1 Tax=Phaedon cochleariae TaxID=80249 RepID=A0A9N9S959_PHACE|nr:unnamed protein product [Phaedon cochleariae]
MFMTDVHRKEEIRNVAIKHLRKYGIKYRGKTTRHPQAIKSKKLFKVPIQNLENETVTLKNGQQLIVPKRLHEMCSYILTKVETEGIFRKEGSKSRQNEIKLSLDRGCMLGIEHHVIDVAVILKCFLRELPEPLIPYSFHELYLRCSLIEKKTEALLLSCLLLPTEHLNILSYLMQFLNEVASYSKYNKMNSYNISVILGPNIFPVNEKIAPKNKLMVKKTCDIIKFMIDNSNNIGLIPDFILEQISNLKAGDLENADKVKRRRSGSLTRIFNGLKKMVSTRTEPEHPPDLILTQSIPQNVDKFTKLRCHEEPAPPKKNILERRWSAITSATTFKRKKRESFIYHPNENITSNSPKADYVRVSKTEYEEIKSRVSAIEKRLSLEIENAQSTVVHNEVNIIHDIQSAYEKTLGQAEQMSPGTDQLARRLSRELRIRNSDQKMIRSPSARKIGTIRRRSREGERPPKVARNPSFDHIKNSCKPSTLTRSISSPIQSNILINTNIFSPSLQVDARTRVSIQSKHSTSPSIGDKSPGNRSRSRERRALRRNVNVTPRRPILKQRLYNFDGHRFIEISEDNDHNKENNLEEKGVWTPSAVPHIKRAISVVRSPKRLCITPKVARVNTPLRVLPNTNMFDL